MNRTIHLYQLWQLITAYLKEIIREPGILFWGIIFPILMSLGLGLAFTKKANVERKVAIVNFDSTGTKAVTSPFPLLTFLRQFGDVRKKADGKEESYELTLADENLGNTTFLFQVMNWPDAMVRLKRGTLNLVLVPKGRLPEYHFDPLNPDAQLTYLKLAGIFGQPPLSTENQAGLIKPLTVKGTRYIDFLIPGLIAMGVMMSSIWGISYGIIEKRSKKLLRRMVATPMKRSHLLIALMTVRSGMNFVEALLLFCFAYFAFGITITGSIPALILLFFAGNIAFAGIAVFISSNTSSTEVGNGFINAVVLPMMVLSGIFFSYHNFPEWSLPFIQLLPLTMLADGIRSLFIEGAGMVQVAMPSLILLMIGTVFFTAGLKLFKWH